MPKQDKIFVPPIEELDKLEKKIRAANEVCRESVVEAVNEFMKKYPDADIHQIDISTGSGLSRTFDSLAELCGWCYVRLNHDRMLTKIRRALGYSYP